MYKAINNFGAINSSSEFCQNSLQTAVVAQVGGSAGFVDKILWYQFYILLEIWSVATSYSWLVTKNKMYRLELLGIVFNFQSWKQLYNHKCLSVCPSSKPPPSFNLHPSSFNFHSSSFNLHLLTFILCFSPFILHFATFKLFSLFALEE